MNIGQNSFEEFKDMATRFHGYPAPCILIGGYMVEAARSCLSPQTLFRVLVETSRCLPDAVQLLPPCTAGNSGMRLLDLGRYALSMFDKHSGEGVRVAVDTEKVKVWPEINSWFLRLRTKAQQDQNRLFQEIEEAGDSILSLCEVRIKSEYLKRLPQKRICICPICDEAYPEADGAICRGCQGQAPYAMLKGPKGKNHDVSPAALSRRPKGIA
jgi:formylmethanofuran dehydrogenase subunit E